MALTFFTEKPQKGLAADAATAFSAFSEALFGVMGAFITLGRFYDAALLRNAQKRNDKG